MAIVSGVHSYEKLTAPVPAKVEMNLEVVVIPVSDVDRAREFYAKLGWRLDAEPLQPCLVLLVLRVGQDIEHLRVPPDAAAVLGWRGPSAG